MGLAPVDGLGSRFCRSPRRRAWMVKLTTMAKISEAGALKILNREKWDALVRREMKRADGRIPVAAEALGISVRQLHRWLAELDSINRAPPGRPWSKKTLR